MISQTTRDNWLRLDDAQLLADCRVDTYRASGPGGQKRNKTSSAVRLRHKPSGLIAIAEESRSQHENKARAIRRLRMMIALQIRCPCERQDPPAIIREHLNPAGGFEISMRHVDYPRLVGAVLDCLHAHEGSISETGSALEVRTSQLSRFLTGDLKLLAAANQIREKWGLKPLRPAAG
jgi:RF-1 domain